MEQMSIAEQEATCTVDAEEGLSDMLDEGVQVHSTGESVESVDTMQSTLIAPAGPRERANLHPFVSQAELHGATEVAKLTHINQGGFPTNYSQEEWEQWCIGKRMSGSL